ncbi:MAG TPA: hypothetical protein VFI20_02365 [Terracidiphilus sp.]|nr:hypothetical protein [Terracidiphilus sp.]
MNEPLHPLALGETLDRTAQLYRSRFLVYLGIAVIPAGGMMFALAEIFGFVAWMGSWGATHLSNETGAALSVAAVVVLGILAVSAYLGTSALSWAAMSHAAARAFLGEAIGIRDSYRSAWKHGWRYTWLYALQIFFVVGIPAGGLLAAAWGIRLVQLAWPGAGVGEPASMLRGMFLLVMVALGGWMIWMLLRVCLAFPAAVVELSGAWRALKRAATLSVGTRGRIFVMLLLGTALNWILAIGLSFPVMVVMSQLPESKNLHQSQMELIEIYLIYGLWFAVQALTKPVFGIALTLFYFDQRIRKEGFDIEWAMQQAGMVTGPRALVMQSEAVMAVEGAAPGLASIELAVPGVPPT